MNWKEILEQRKALLVGGVVVICVAALLVTARRFNFTLDVYWHIRTGIDWLTNGLSPWQDHYSFTFYGKTIAGQAYMFQAFVGSLVNAFGAQTGLELVRMFSFLSVLALVLVFLRRLKSPTAVYLLALPIVTMLVQQRSVTRPELISYSLIVLAVMLYHRAHGRMTVSGMLPIVLLIGFWTNYHNAILAYVIFFGLFLDAAFQYLRERAGAREWLKWCGWGLAVVVVGALRPGFRHPIVSYFNFSPKWKDLILEYSPLSTKLAHSATPDDFGVYAVGLIAAAAIVLAAWRRRYGLVVVCCLLVYFAIDISRLVTPNGIAMVCFFAWMASETESTAFFRALPRGATAAIGLAAVAVFGIGMYSIVWSAHRDMAMNRTYSTGFPEDVTDYMIGNGISGRIFNEYEHGGYLIYRLAPDSRVYIDGRTNILYSKRHTERFLEARKTPEVLAEEIDKYDIDLALLHNRQASFRLMEDTERLKLDFLGFEHSLFRKDAPNFPLLGTLLARPACWSIDMAPQLLAEREKASRILPERSPAFDYFGVLSEYSAAQDQRQFLLGIDDFSDWNDYMVRFAGYRALAHGLNDTAWELFNLVRTKEFADFLAGALSRVEKEDWRSAELTLDGLTRVNWSIVRRDELGILNALLQRVRANAPLEVFDDAYLDGLAQQFQTSGKLPEKPEVQSFCPES